MTKIITAYDGYIEIHENDFVSYVGNWANEVRSIFYKACRLQGIEPTTQALNEFLTRVVIA